MRKRDSDLGTEAHGWGKAVQGSSRMCFVSRAEMQESSMWLTLSFTLIM